MATNSKEIASIRRRYSVALGSKTLDYDPFQDPDSIQRLIHDLSISVMDGSLLPKQASVIRSLIAVWIKVDEHKRIDRLELRVKAIEEGRSTHE
jgi:hypothetical protein